MDVRMRIMKNDPPTLMDADPWGLVFTYSERAGWQLTSWFTAIKYPCYFTHWMPTGLKRPPDPPRSEMGYFYGH